MDLKTSTVTEEFLAQCEHKWYAAGKELQVGDTIVFGFVNNYATFSGVPRSKYQKDDISLTMNMFVIKDYFIWQAYKLIK